jgi:hypothetical protein
MSSEISPGKSMLLQLREERHAAEQAKQEEFAFEVGAASHESRNASWCHF